MNFLFPAMLAGLAALGVPIALHLIAKHKFPIRDFPTLRLLMRDERTNTFAPRLIDKWQLLLRLLILTLLVLAMARLFSHGFSFSSAPRNLVVVIDGSASMAMSVKDTDGSGKTTLLELARTKATDLLNEIDDSSQSALVVAGDETRVLSDLQPGSAAALAALGNPVVSAPTNGSGQGLLHAISVAGELVRGRREVKSQVIVLTDLRATAFATRNQKDLERLARAHADLGDKLDLVIVDLSGGETDNLGFVSAHIRDGSVKVGDDAHVLARLHNYSKETRTAKLQLAVGNQPDPAITELKLEPGEEAVVDLTTPVNRSVRTVAEVRLRDADALPADDTFSVPLNVDETRRVLIVNGASQAVAADTALSGLGQVTGGSVPAAAPVGQVVDGATILRYVLNPGRELGRASGTGIDTTITSPDALAGQALSRFEMIVLYDVTSLPAQAIEDINTFVRQGRSLLIVGSGGVNPLQFNRLFFSADPQRPGLSPAQLGNDRESSPALGLPAEPGNTQWLAPYRDRLQGDLATIRFTHTREIPMLAPAATVMMSAADGSPLAVEMPLEKGRVALLAFGFELDRGNIARTRIFPSLMWRLVDSLTGRLRVLPPDVLTAQQPAVLDVSETGFSFASQLELTVAGDDERPPLLLDVGPNQTVLVPPLPAGVYQLHKPRITGAVAGHTRNITIHADPRESDMTSTNAADLDTSLSLPVKLVSLSDPLDLTPSGGEFWRLLVWLLVIAYVVEALTGYLLSARREKQRMREGTA